MTEKSDEGPAHFSDFRSSIYDTEYFDHKKAFGAFRDVVQDAFMSWTIEIDPDNVFDARVECLSTDTEAVARGTNTPIIAFRGAREIQKSSSDSYYANFVLAGELNIEQAGRSFDLRRGDLIVYDSSLPLKMTQRSSKIFDHLAFRIPKEKLNQSPHIESLLRHAVIRSDKMMTPLCSCLNFLAQNLVSSGSGEMRALYDTCTLLMPLSASHLMDETTRGEDFDIPPKHYVSELLSYIDTHIGEMELSPRSAADRLGISVRYVHKLFAITGTTFSAHVLAKRLDLVRRDLICTDSYSQPISTIAYRWGFNDISAFIRAFKRKYGCSPSEYRAKF